MPVEPVGHLVNPPQPINVSGALSQFAQMGLQRDSQRALAEQRQALAEERTVKTAEAERQLAEQAQWRQALQGAYKPDGTIDQDALFKAVSPELMPLAQKTVVESQAMFQKFQKDRAESKAALIKDMATRVRQLGDNPTVFGTALRAIVESGALSQEEATTVLQRAAQGPQGIKAVLDSILHPEGQKLTGHDPAHDLINPAGEIVRAGIPKAQPETRSLDVQAADALAKGDTATYNRLIKVKKEMGRADDRPVDPTVAAIRDITLANAKLSLGTLHPRFQSRVDAVAKGFDAQPVVKRVQTMAESVGFAQSLDPKTTNPSDDQGLIYAFAKAMDPESVVREGEYATVQKYAQSWAEQFGFSAARVFSNTTFLTEQARSNMKATITKKFEASKGQYDNLRKSYAERINRITGQQDGADRLIDYGGAFPGGAAPTADLIYDPVTKTFKKPGGGG